jgi:hypothetical protein
MPETTRITIQRYRFEPDEQHIKKLLGIPQYPPFDYWSISTA